MNNDGRCRVGYRLAYLFLHCHPQPNERPGESLLDLDFDAFQPDESVSPIPQVPFT